MNLSREFVATSRQLGFAALCYSLLLAVVFYKNFQPETILFANDGPLGMIGAHSVYGWLGLSGRWMDLFWLGSETPAPAPNITTAFVIATGPLSFGTLGPVIYLKLFAPLSLLLLGLSAWWYFRQLGLHPYACLIAGAACWLNTNSFSNACWGLPSWVLAKAMFFLALGLVLTRSCRPGWIRLVLAGAAIGIGVTEGFDTGALFSLFFAAIALYHLMARENWTSGRDWLVAGGKLGLIVACSALVTLHTLDTLYSTQVKGISGTQQDAATRQARFDFATQWSLPKAEVLRFAVPGLFGYRMDSAEGGQYWGRVGEVPGRPGTRYSGSGEYAGIIVLLLAVWAIAQSFRGDNGPFNRHQRQLIWLLTGLGFVSLLLAFGRHSFLYEIFYQIPGISTVRNPIKFTQPFHACLGVLFALGLDALARRHLAPATNSVNTPILKSVAQLMRSGNVFDRRWLIGLAATAGLSLLFLCLYIASSSKLETYLAKSGFSADQAKDIAAFSNIEGIMFLFFFVLSAGVFAAITAGYFSISGRRIRMAWLALAAILVVDFYRANLPWIRHENYQATYASNPLLETLAPTGNEARVGFMSVGVQNNPQAMQYLQMLQTVYRSIWIHKIFPHYRIQTIDISQEPRVSEQKLAYQRALAQTQLPLRYWQLTNPRYLLGMAGLAEALNAQIASGNELFRTRLRFALQQSAPDQAIQVITNAAGPFALIEYTKALPRALLYRHWQPGVSDTAALAKLSAPDFDPHSAVLVADDIPVPTGPNGAPGTPDTARLVDYRPNQLRFETESDTATVMLLNDQHHPAWQVFVDDSPQPLLRCNALMRGLFLEPGTHRVEFRYQPRSAMLILSVTAMLACIALAGIAVIRSAIPPRN